jgi:hypothetical protein
MNICVFLLAHSLYRLVRITKQRRILSSPTKPRGYLVRSARELVFFVHSSLYILSRVISAPSACISSELHASLACNSRPPLQTGVSCFVPCGTATQLCTSVFGHISGLTADDQRTHEQWHSACFRIPAHEPACPPWFPWWPCRNQTSDAANISSASLDCVAPLSVHATLMQLLNVAFQLSQAVCRRISLTKKQAFSSHSARPRNQHHTTFHKADGS